MRIHVSIPERLVNWYESLAVRSRSGVVVSHIDFGRKLGKRIDRVEERLTGIEVRLKQIVDLLARIKSADWAPPAKGENDDSEESEDDEEEES